MSFVIKQNQHMQNIQNKHLLMDILIHSFKAMLFYHCIMWTKTTKIQNNLLSLWMPISKKAWKQIMFKIKIEFLHYNLQYCGFLLCFFRIWSSFCASFSFDFYVLSLLCWIRLPQVMWLRYQEFFFLFLTQDSEQCVQVWLQIHFWRQCPLPILRKNMRSKSYFLIQNDKYSFL